jgi:hypothetical protein
LKRQFEHKNFQIVNIFLLGIKNLYLDPDPNLNQIQQQPAFGSETSKIPGFGSVFNESGSEPLTVDHDPDMKPRIQENVKHDFPL